MRSAIHDYVAYPYTAQLARSLAGRGHEVLYLYGGGVRAPRAATHARASDPAALRIEPVGLAERLHSRAGVRRLLQERRYGRALAGRLAEHRPGVVLSVPSSLDGQSAALRATQQAGGAFVFWVQDLYSKAIAGLLGRRSTLAGRLIGSRFARMERSILNASDGVVAITEDFLPTLDAWHIPRERVAIIPNWAPLDEVRPMPKSNAWSKEHGLGDRLIFLYAGTLGRKHDPTLLLALARELPEATVVVVSEGAGTERLRAMGDGLANLVLLPLQPAERLGEVLGSADVLVAILDQDANVFSVPSKVLTYLTAGRPILAAIPDVNGAARTIAESAAGRVVEPSDPSGFIAAARALVEDPAGRVAAATAGREYAERMFDIEAITDRFESVLEAAIQHAHSGHAPRTDTSETQ